MSARKKFRISLKVSYFHTLASLTKYIVTRKKKAYQDKQNINYLTISVRGYSEFKYSAFRHQNFSQVR